MYKTRRANGRHQRRNKDFQSPRDVYDTTVKNAFLRKFAGTILSMKDIANIPGVRIRMDTMLDRAIFVEYDGKTYKFTECDEGLYYYDVTDKCGHNLSNNKYPLEEYSCLQTVTKNEECPYSFLQTVTKNQSYYTKRQIKLAEKARKYQSYLAWPSTQELKDIVRDNLLINCGVTVDDVDRADTIFGDPIPLLKGKMCRRSPIRHPRQTKMRLPLEFLRQHKDLNLFVDIFFVNESPFFLLKSGNINYISVSFFEINKS